MSGYPRPSRVVAVPLGDLAAIAHAQPVGVTVSVTGVTHDSQRVQPGDLYVGLAGSRRHGAEFAAEAAGRGAVALLTDQAGADRVGAAGLPVLVTADPRAVMGPVAAAVYGDPTAGIPVVGITGTAGKTSVAYLVEAGLAAAGYTTCLVGTVETRIAGVALDSERTTPEATDLQALFAVARERGVTAAVMEVSSHALAYGRVNGMRFAVGGFTNFGLDHLDFHADVDDYFAAKARLFDGRCRAEIGNLDDPAVRRLRSPGRGTSRTSSFSAAGDADATWRAEDITPDGFGQRFTAVGPPGRIPIQVALPGQHNVANALLALASLVEVGVAADIAAAGIAACRGVPGRLELVGAPGPVLGVVDYAHKPDAIVAALAALRGLVSAKGRGRLICVIGAGGDRDRGKRPFMGEAAARGADVVVVTDDNPRSEDPAVIRAEVLTGAITAATPAEPRTRMTAATPAEPRTRMTAATPAEPRTRMTAATPAGGGARVIEVAGRREAIAEAVALAQPGDVVAVLGKGHERGQEVAGIVSPFDDRVELAAALTERWSRAGAAR